MIRCDLWFKRFNVWFNAIQCIIRCDLWFKRFNVWFNAIQCMIRCDSIYDSLYDSMYDSNNSMYDSICFSTYDSVHWKTTPLSSESERLRSVHVSKLRLRLVQLWPTLDPRRLVWIYYIVFQWNRYLRYTIHFILTRCAYSEHYIDSMPVVRKLFQKVITGHCSLSLPK